MFGSRLEVRRFEDRIVKHEAYPVEEGMILFYGHSLFTRRLQPMPYWNL